MVRSTNLLNKLNQEIGIKIKNLRVSKGLSKNALASNISVSNQQVTKYENGENKITAARLFLIAKSLNVPMSYFFTTEQGEEFDEGSRLSLELVRNFSRIKSQKLRETLTALARAISE